MANVRKDGKPTLADRKAANKALHAKLQAGLSSEKAKTPKRAVGKIKAAKKDPANPLMNDGHEWNREIVMSIVCARTATRTGSLVRLLREDYQGWPLPDSTAIYDWLRQDKTLALAYSEAKKSQAEILVEEMIDIADDGTNDYIEREGKSGTFIALDNEHVQRSRLRIDTRKWLAEKLNPRLYGPQLALTGKDGGPIRTQSTVLSAEALTGLNDAELDALLVISEKLNAAGA